VPFDLRHELVVGLGLHDLTAFAVDALAHGVLLSRRIGRSVSTTRVHPNCSTLGRTLAPQ
jgi:hypothetical protein